jgi:serine/threonine-protein kinase
VKEIAVDLPPRAYSYPRLSPDGGRVVLRVADEDDELWVWDVARMTLTRLTFAVGADLYPVWSHDGRRVLFTSERDGPRNVYSQVADGTGAAERLTTSPDQQLPTAVTPDGAQLIFTGGTGADVMQVAVTGTHTVTPLVHTPATERNGVVSPDGRWLAYDADDSGQLEIYVRPYPEVDSGRWQVSTAGGTRPLWSPDGRELFYVSPSNALLRVGVERGESWTATTPTMVLKDGSVVAPPGVGGRTYEVSPDGQRFLVVKEVSDSNASPPQIVIVQHFVELLKQLVPVN